MLEAVNKASAFDAHFVAEVMPAESPAMIALGMLILLLGGMSLVTWSWIAACWRRGEDPIPFEPRQNIPWRFVEVGLVIGFVLFSTIAGAAMQQPEQEEPFTPDDLSRGLIANAAFYLVLAGMVALFLLVVRRATARDLGWNIKLPSDLLYGVFGFFSAVLPVYILQIVLVRLVDQGRQQHPLIEMLQAEPRIDLLVMAGVTAVVIAPLVEEFLFRVLLQGWLEKVFAPEPEPPLEAELLADEAAANDQGSVNAQLAEQPPAVDHRLAALYYPTPLESPHDAYLAPQSDLGTRHERGTPLTSKSSFLREALPIAISAVLFAAAHAGTWPDPVPLFVLALALGYIYRQTHRLWPSVVLHMIFNSLALAMVWLSSS